ncbi:MAG: hypothetical protein M5U34_15295 [Chloroflexi bacterium]|nr:hypothetical protein [Chloroflexota bacterium]
MAYGGCGDRGQRKALSGCGCLPGGWQRPLPPLSVKLSGVWGSAAR